MLGEKPQEISSLSFSNAREGRSKDKSHDLHPAYANVRIKSKTLEGAMTEFQRTHSDSDHEWAYVVDGSGFVHRYVEDNAHSVSVYSGSRDSTILHNHQQKGEQQGNETRSFGKFCKELMKSRKLKRARNDKGRN